MHDVLKPLMKLEAEANETYEKGLKEHKKKIADLRSKIRRAKAQNDDDLLDLLELQLGDLEDKPPVRTRYVTTDATVEKLGTLLAENSFGILLARDELKGLLSRLDREDHQSERSFYLQAWNGYGAYIFDRISRGTTQAIP
jgi:hypothetical protein